MAFFKNTIYRYKFTLALGCIIVLLSLLPSSSIPSNPMTTWRGFDKFVHFSMYAVLSFTLFFEMRCEKGCIAKYILTAILILSFSSLLELFQKLFNALERSAELLDFVANLLGILAGLILYRIFLSIKS